MINYELLAETEYSRYAQNYGTGTLQQQSAPFDNLAILYNEHQMQMAEHLSHLTTAVKDMRETVNRPRIKTPYRDENGIITHVVEE